MNLRLIAGSVVLALSACGPGVLEPGAFEPAPEAAPALLEPVAAFSVTGTSPESGALSVPTNQAVHVRFSVPMKRDTLDSTTFTLTSGNPAVAVPGTVFTTQSTASFRPAFTLAGNTLYTATISAAVMSTTGVALGVSRVWTFTTGFGVGPVQPVSLGKAAPFAVLARAAVSTGPGSFIAGNLGLSPAAAAYLTGFGERVHSSNVFSTSSQVTGRILAADYTTPTPYNLSVALTDLELAIADAASRPTNVIDLCGGNIGGLTMTAGVYRFTGGLLVPTDVTLAGGEDDVWIFQVGQDLSMGEGARIILVGGAQAKNVFWEVAGMVSLAPRAHAEGAMLAQTGIDLKPGASINGWLLAQAAVILDAAKVTLPGEP